MVESLYQCCLKPPQTIYHDQKLKMTGKYEKLGDGNMGSVAHARQGFSILTKKGCYKVDVS